ncbi:MAG: NADH-quinone oxidoreductase subunit A, partial [Paramuribaculum sp.]|nr:NADH-quinone oxidoreductase subunit A [Paramuribaculum sp.]
MISLSILNSTLAITAAVTGIGLVALAMWIAKLISPRSFNVQKGEPYECGIPTRGESMSQFHVG